MKILFLTSRYPFPPVGGDKLRAYNIIRYLVDQGHSVDLLSLTHEDAKKAGFLKNEKLIRVKKHESYLSCLLGLVSQKPLQVWYYDSSAFNNEVRKAVAENKYDLIFCHLLRTAEYAKNIRGIPKIVDLTDAISLNYERVSKRLLHDLSVKNLMYSFEKKRVLSYEGEIISKFDSSILISDIDKNYLGKFFDVSNVKIIENGVDTEYFAFHGGEYDHNKIIFFGNMRYLPNSDAVINFAENIFPFIKKEIPAAKFVVAGSEPGKKVLELNKEKDIHVTGFVDDLREHIRSATVSVAPMRYGAGMQNKILESMALGVPVVTSSLGFEGIRAEKDKDIIVEDQPEKFANKVVTLMKDEELRKSFSESGRFLVENHYTWKSALEKLGFLLNEYKAVS